MDATLEDALARGVRIYEWCIWETLRPCIIDEDSPLYGHLPAGVRVINPDGWRSLPDLLAAKDRVSEETWMAEYLNLRPKHGALIYSQFSREHNVSEDAGYIPGAGRVYVGADWGFTDETVLLLTQLRGGRLFIFDELVGTGTSEREWARKLIGSITRLEDYDGPDMKRWEGIWKTGAWRDASFPLCWPSGAVDPSAVQLRSELREHGVSMASPKRTTHRVASGQDVVKALLQGSEPRLMIHPRCKKTIDGLENLRARRLPDGSYSATPDPDAKNHRWSHCPDALRYLVWVLRRQLGLVAEDADDEEEGDDG